VGTTSTIRVIVVTIGEDLPAFLAAPEPAGELPPRLVWGAGREDRASDTTPAPATDAAAEVLPEARRARAAGARRAARERCPAPACSDTPATDGTLAATGVAATVGVGLGLDAIAATGLGETAAVSVGALGVPSDPGCDGAEPSLPCSPVSFERSAFLASLRRVASALRRSLSSLRLALAGATADAGCVAGACWTAACGWVTACGWALAPEWAAGRRAAARRWRAGPCWEDRSVVASVPGCAPAGADEGVLCVLEALGGA
jgi:hypothetical protein